MSFLREKDNWLHERARIAQRNAELAIEKQGELIRCLANISVVLGKGLMVGTLGGPSDMDSGTAVPEDGRLGGAHIVHPNNTNGTNGI
jgi:hypothetical protein